MKDVYFSTYKSGANGSPAEPQPDKPQNQSKQPKKKHRLLKSVFFLLLIFFIVFSVSFGYLFNLMRTTDYNPSGHTENVYVDSADLMQDKNVVNILFIGVDRRAEDISSRSDSMILFSIDKNNKKIKLTSFMRDTWVDIPDHGYAKLNASCTYGGAQLVMDTIEYNFNIHIDSYLLVDFDTFVSIVNKLGGVSVEISEPEAEYMRDKVHLDINSGSSVHLNGKEALWYCRIRYLDSDFMRTFRQRKVVSSIIKEAKDTNIIDLLNLVKAILPGIETDLDAFDLSKLSVGAALKFIRYDIEQARVPADNTWENATKDGQSVLLADIGRNQKMLKEFLYTPDSEKITTAES